ncbi:MAG TPA: carboxypeptidase-like regulatory domain-containing protein, partial [Vicinamibacteria bacterium]|nr:carboxypeptidase-like regulatory domain-containing protein [Vicinamibacteria bacterium]
ALVSGDEPDTPAGSATVERRISVLKSGFAAAQVTAAAGDNPSPLVVTLSHGIELQGRVTATDGTPVAGVAVSAAEDGSVGGMYASHLLLTEVRKEGWATSDESGRFALRVNPGPHHLSFDRAGYAHQVVRSHDPRSGPLDVVLEPAAAVRGRVTRADGRALASAIVGIGSSPRTAQGVEDVLTNGEGRFELGGLTPGVHELRVRHEGLGAMLVRTVEAPADDVQVVLAPSVTVRGRVLDAASRQPVPRFELVLTTAGSHREVPVEDPAGSFTVEEVPIGEVRLSISAEGYAERKVEGLSFERDDEPAPLEILLDAEALVRGRVTDQAGAPLPEANVGVLGPGPYRSQTTSGEDGEYELHGVPPGETRLGFSAAGYVSETRAIDTRESTRLDVTLKRGLTLRGEVVKAGAGVPEAHVAARTSVAGASLQTTQTDDKGRFVLEGLVPGRYTVTARASGAGSARLDDVDAQTAGPLRLTLDKAPTAVIRGKVVGLSERDLGITMIVVSSEETRESAHGSVDSSMAFRIEDAPAGRVKVLGVATSMEEGVARSSRTVELTVPPGTEAETVIEFASDIVVSGTVTRDGGPVPFAKVTFRSDLDGGAAARADTRGHYEAVGLEPGFYQVSVTGDDVSFVTEYAVTASAEFDIDVTGGSIEGHVVHADGGAPVAGVDVSFFRLGRGENRPAGSATTGARGAFAERPLREGRYRLVTSMAGFGQEVREVDLPRGGTVEAVIELSPADGVGVTVVDARDSRPLDAIVVVRDQARRIVANRHSGADESGALHIPLADGAYLLSTSASGYGTVTLPVTAPAQGLRVGLTPGGTLVIESERDLRGRVRLVQPDGEEYVRCWCNGIAEIQLKGRRTNVENVTPGSYTVEIVDSPEATPPRPVVVREGQTSTVVIE